MSRVRKHMSCALTAHPLQGTCNLSTSAQGCEAQGMQACGRCTWGRHAQAQSIHAMEGLIKQQGGKKPQVLGWPLLLRHERSNDLT